MYNGYGERRVKFAHVSVAQIAALIPAGAVPEGATLHAVVLAEPTSNPCDAEVRLIYTHESFPICLSGGTMPEVAAPESPDPTPDVPTASLAASEGESAAATPTTPEMPADAPENAPEHTEHTTEEAN